MSESKSLEETAGELVGKMIDEGCKADGKHPRNPFVWAAFNELLAFLLLEAFEYDEVAQRVQLAWEFPERAVTGKLEEVQDEIDRQLREDDCD